MFDLKIDWTKSLVTYDQRPVRLMGTYKVRNLGGPPNYVCAIKIDEDTEELTVVDSEGRAVAPRYSHVYNKVTEITAYVIIYKNNHYPQGATYSVCGPDAKDRAETFVKEQRAAGFPAEYHTITVNI